MSAPVLDRKLVLESPVQTPDGAGGRITAWTPLGIHWAQITAGTGRERAAYALPLSRVPLRIIVRGAAVGSSARPFAGQRFRDGVRVYAILSVTDHSGPASYLTCQAQEEVAA